MAITIDGDGTITGLSVGGLPDGVVDADMLAANAVTTAKISDSQITNAKLASDPQKGLAKAWINFDGTGTISILRSFNVSSITDEGTGQFLVNFSVTLNTNACVVVSNGNDVKFVSRNLFTTGSMTSATQAYFATFSSNAIDADFCNMAVFDD